MQLPLAQESRTGVVWHTTHRESMVNDWNFSPDLPLQTRSGPKKMLGIYVAIDKPYHVDEYREHIKRHAASSWIQMIWQVYFQIPTSTKTLAVCVHYRNANGKYIVWKCK